MRSNAAEAAVGPGTWMKAFRTRVNIVLLWSALLGGVSASPGVASAPPFEVVRTAQAEGAIVPARQSPAGMFGLPTSGTWTPSRADVERLEARLPAYLRDPLRSAPRSTSPLGLAPTADEASSLAARLGEFRRQYFGVTVDGRRHVIVSGFPKDGLAYWREQLVFVFDGGCAYWRAAYDVQAEQFVGLGCNGQA